MRSVETTMNTQTDESANWLPLLFEIIKVGVPRIRCSGWAGDAERCADEADHIHNLPDAVSSPSKEKLQYY
jgi:hypothetical protein